MPWDEPRGPNKQNQAGLTRRHGNNHRLDADFAAEGRSASCHRHWDDAPLPGKQMLPRVFFRELPLSLHMEHQVSAFHIVDDEEQPAGRSTRRRPKTASTNAVRQRHFPPTGTAAPGEDVLCSGSQLLPTLCLEAGVKSHQEGVGGGLLEDVLLGLHPVNVLQGRRDGITRRHQDQAVNPRQASHGCRQ